MRCLILHHGARTCTPVSLTKTEWQGCVETIKGLWYYNKISFLCNGGEKSEQLIFFTSLQWKSYQKNVLGCFFHVLLFGRLWHLNIEKVRFYDMSTLKNAGSQTVDGSHWLPLYRKSTTEVNGYRQLFGYQLPSKCLLLCSTEETHTGLEQVGGEQMMTDFFFILGELSL